MWALQLCLFLASDIRSPERSRRARCMLMSLLFVLPPAQINSMRSWSLGVEEKHASNAFDVDPERMQ
jgi:hypothetical protein